MMMMMMMMNCFCGMVDQRNAFRLISNRNHCQRSSPSRIFGMPRAGFEPAQNLSSGLVERNCAVMITSSPRRQDLYPYSIEITENADQEHCELGHFSRNEMYCITLPGKHLPAKS